MKKPHRSAVGTVLAVLSSAVVVAAATFSTAAHAMSLGHSRLLSPVGQPLRIQTPISGLSAQDIQSLSVTIAPATAWQESGLVPPVDLSSMQVAVIDGVKDGSKLIIVSSPQALSSGLADILMVVRSASGQIQHQVSLLAPADLQVAAAAVAQVNHRLGAVAAGAKPLGNVSGQSIRVRQGDTLMSLARRHAVPGVSIYQWMVAVQAANPSAFIRDNVNLVRIDATLTIPDQATLTAMSDAQARRVFQQHAHAFAQYRQRLASQKGPPIKPAEASQGTLRASDSADSMTPPATGQDKVVLSSSTRAVAGEASDNALAVQKNTEDARKRLATLEDNVANLSQALQQQGGAASEVARDSVEVLADTVEKAVDAVTKEVDPGSGPTIARVEMSSGAPAISGAPEISSSVAPAPSSSQPSSKSSSFVSWFQDHLWATLAGALLVVVALVALLRRAATRSANQNQSGITEDMVRERLQGINLDLDEPSKGDSGADR